MPNEDKKRCSKLVVNGEAPVISKTVKNQRLKIENLTKIQNS